MLRLILASVLALGFSSTVVDARRVAPAPITSQVVFEVDQRLKLDAGLPEFEFRLYADGTWRYIETRQQSIQRQAAGKLSRATLTQIRRLLAGAQWNVTRGDVACMAFAMQTVHYTVNGRSVWTDEMCSGNMLDARSANRLAQVMAIVNPLIDATR